MNSINNAIQRSSAGIPIVATATANTSARSRALGSAPNRNAVRSEVEDLKARLVGFEAAFATMEARLNLLTAQQEAPAPTGGNRIGSDPEMSVCS